MIVRSIVFGALMAAGRGHGVSSGVPWVSQVVSRASSPESSSPPGDSITLSTPTGTLFGTLELPSTRGPYPVVLIISGSGPTDRDGNSPPALSPPNNSLRLLAEALAAHGMASVRYDKRGVGASRPAASGGEEALRFDTYVNDAAAWVRRLRRDRRFRQVVVAGHSEGALVGILAARGVPVDGVISLEGAGRPAADELREQLAARMPAVAAQAETYLVALSKGETVDSVPPELTILFRPSVQPYMISWFRYDPGAEIAHLSVPVLVVQGTSDIQVPVTDAAILTRAAPKARLLTVDGMNHLLKIVPADDEGQARAYTDATIPVAPQVIDGMTDFIRGLRPTSPSKRRK